MGGVSFVNRSTVSRARCAGAHLVDTRKTLTSDEYPAEVLALTVVLTVDLDHGLNEMDIGYWRLRFSLRVDIVRLINSHIIIIIIICSAEC